MHCNVSNDKGSPKSANISLIMLVPLLTPGLIDFYLGPDEARIVSYYDFFVLYMSQLMIKSHQV